MTIDGVSFPEVGLRKKGFLGSLNAFRPSLKIKLNHVDKKASIKGLTNLTLNNNQQDHSLVSQFMGLCPVQWPSALPLRAALMPK